MDDIPAPRPAPALRPAPSSGRFARLTLIALVLIVLVLLLWQIQRVLLLGFAAILLGVLLRGLAGLVKRYLHVPGSASLAVCLVALALLFAGLGYLFGASLIGQILEVLESLPEATDRLGERFGIGGASQIMSDAVSASLGDNLLSRIAGAGYTLVGSALDVIIVLVAGIYLAADPEVYRKGAAKLAPPRIQSELLKSFDMTATALRLWFVGQTMSMAGVGVLSGLAFWQIGLPSPFILGVIAGITNFIPFLGPIIGTVPAVILAATIGTDTILWTVAAVFAIQQLEGDLITPMAQRRTVSMPPAVGLFAILAFGILFGPLGVLLAMPMAVALMVMVNKFWVRDTLKQETHVAGEPEDD